MLNFIPKEERKKIVKNFYYRLVILFFITTGLIVSIAFVLILPTYFLSSVKNNITENKIQEQKLSAVLLPDQKVISIIKDLDYKLSLIEKARENTFLVSQNAINAVLLKKSSNIKITDFSFESNSLQGKKIGIQGTAPSREALLLFRQALEDDANFKQVDLPISNFIKGQNIEFYLSLIPR